MQRSTLDKLISSSAVIVAIALLAASVGLLYANNFVHGQVTSQLESQKISLPAKGTPAFTSLPAIDQAAIGSNAGNQVVTGTQAELFADHYIAVHLNKIGGGKTYSELSAASMANPTDTALAGKVETVFKGETLRGLLLNAYAFDTMATVALVASIGAFIAGMLLIILALLGFSHAKQVKKK